MGPETPKSRFWRCLFSARTPPIELKFILGLVKAVSSATVAFQFAAISGRRAEAEPKSEKWRFSAYRPKAPKSRKSPCSTPRSSRRSNLTAKTGQNRGRLTCLRRSRCAGSRFLARNREKPGFRPTFSRLPKPYGRPQGRKNRKFLFCPKPSKNGQKRAKTRF